MLTVTIKVIGDNEHQAIQALADATVDLEVRGFKKSQRLIINKINGEFTFTQEYRKRGSYAGVFGDIGQCNQYARKVQAERYPL